MPSTHLAELVDRALLLVKRGDADDEARALLERVPIEAPSLEKRAPEDNRRVGMASLLLGRLSERRAKAPARTTVATVATADEALLDHYNELVRLYAQTPISMDTLSCGQLGMARATEYYRAASEAMAAQLADDLRKHGDNAALDGKTYLVIFESRGVAQDKQALLTVEGALTIGAAGRDPVDETDCVAALQKLRGDLRAKLGK